MNNTRAKERYDLWVCTMPRSVCVSVCVCVCVCACVRVCVHLRFYRTELELMSSLFEMFPMQCPHCALPSWSASVDNLFRRNDHRFRVCPSRYILTLVHRRDVHDALRSNQMSPRVGVELDLPVGKLDGEQGGHRYFTCPKRYGILTSPNKVQNKIPPSKCLSLLYCIVMYTCYILCAGLLLSMYSYIGCCQVYPIRTFKLFNSNGIAALS